MKPRTKLHHRVIELSRALPRATKEHEDWAFKHCLEHTAFRTSRTIFCLDCGHVESKAVTNRYWVCPGCGSRLRVTRTLSRKDKQAAYFGIITRVEEFQVVRMFDMFGYYRKGEKMRRYFNEIVQYWILPNGKCEIVARNRTQNWYVDTWNGDLEIRDNQHPKYYITAYKFHPSYKVSAELKRNGFQGNLYGASPVRAFKAILENSYTETLLKARQPALFRLSVENPHEVRRLWPSIKIALRNNYIVPDASMWTDLIRMLTERGRDIRNAKYVCPKNLKAEHDALVTELQQIRRRRSREQQRQKAIEDEQSYRQAKGKFFDIAMTYGRVYVEVIKSVHDVMLEGDAMHHCVFSSGYHMKKDSLLFSAKVNGERVETVEFSLEKMEVIQCRGRLNKTTEHHDAIVALVNKNKCAIQERLQP